MRFIEGEAREEELPRDTESFLRWLHRQHPHQCPQPGDSLEEIYWYAGKRALIDGLMIRYFGPDKRDW